MKWVTLLLLVMQTVASVMMIRFASLRSVSRSSAEEAEGGKAPPVRFLQTTVVALAEVFKFVASFAVLWAEAGFTHPVGTLRRVRSSLFGHPVDTLKLGVPAALYTLQNNLVFVALANLSGAVYQVTYQIKILTTAVLSVIILRKRLSMNKWGSLLLLTLGVILIQLAILQTPPQAPKIRGSGAGDLQQPVTSTPTAAGTASFSEEEAAGEQGVSGEQAKGGPVNKSGDLVRGLTAIFAASFTSAFAGVYLEKILQDTAVSIWVRNIQLAAFGMLFGFVAAYWTDGDRIQADGFFQGYTPLVWAILLLQGVGGLIVASVLKYADNILKCFGNAFSILLSCLLSWWLLGDYYPNSVFCGGAVLVVLATCAYTMDVSRLVDSVLGRDAAVRYPPTGGSAYARVSTELASEAEADREMIKSGTATFHCGALPVKIAT
ncbi:UNVERIFIED_CONTAM: hypothetical protein H355_011455 [Colinus virginianus]|nr:hypothetical protein H355_011455 [Colinus virginianus]